jgi:thioredoxin 1
MLAPVSQECPEDQPELTVVTVDVDKSEELSSFYDIRNLPTLLFFKEGDEISRWVGSATQKDLENLYDAIAFGAAS